MSRATTRREPVLRSVDPALRGGDAVPRHSEPMLKAVIATTTQAVEGRPVAAYLGILTGEATLSAASLREEKPKGLLRFLRRKPEGAAGSLAEAREEALRELKGRAAAKGADAILGVSFDCHALDDLLMVSATGTAVRLGQAQED